MSAHDDACAELLRDWAAARTNLIGEFSGNTTASYREMIAEAQAWTTRLGIAWSDDLVPGYVWDTLRYTDEHERDGW